MSKPFVLVLTIIIITILSVSVFISVNNTFTEISFLAIGFYLLRPFHLGAFLFLIGFMLFFISGNIQPISLSLCTLMILPVINLLSSKEHISIFVFFIMLIILIMFAGLMVVQFDKNLGGSIYATITQIISVFLLWVSFKLWVEIDIINNFKDNKVALFLIFVLVLSANQFEALLILFTLIGVTCCQKYSLLCHQNTQENILYWIIPSVAFGSLFLVDGHNTPNIIIFVWFLILLSGWLSNFMIHEEDFDN
ncbi:hypothetical protein CF386_05605 [Paraphotobacterium marinum]|uniref:Uncharacterized protein n=1 Tax=Paraphotobacterium marinum TaxID=1755811 RepID=A0A220VDU7_9GAMM|nr:hypothetical protein [Paraphotobacterium marinum]ASK78517.1 hypothetical protein CF386_05605 [Paraphotobacterium marinum]